MSVSNEILNEVLKIQVKDMSPFTSWKLAEKVLKLTDPYAPEIEEMDDERLYLNLIKEMFTYFFCDIYLDDVYPSAEILSYYQNRKEHFKKLGIITYTKSILNMEYYTSK